MRLFLTSILLTVALYSCSHQENKSVYLHTSNGDSILVQLDVIVDPYCDMNVVETHCNDTAVYQGKVYGFCSSLCKEEVLATPEKYIK